MVRDARGRRFARRARSLFARPRGRINLRELRRLDFFSGAFQNVFIIPKGMKIAVTSQNGSVFQHFGRAPEFAVFDAEDGKITGAEVISCGGSGHGALAGLLGDKKIDVLICGGIGAGAVAALSELGIKVTGGASGDVRKCAEDYLAGKLESDPDFHCGCHDGGGEHSCGGGDCRHGHC